MRSVVWLTGFLWLVTILPAGAGGTDEQAWVGDSRLAARALGGALVAELSGALAVSPVEAISVCSIRAPEIAAQRSAATGAEVGRTALRVRNPANGPLDWQRAVLERFVRDIEAGADPATLEYTNVVETGGATERRWMRPIMTAPLCLECHGAQLAPEVARAVAGLYPEDRATGFAAGELRGAFYVVWREPK